MKPDFLTADNLGPVKHGFFTRQGGVSQGTFDSLNCSYSSSDQRENVTENRSRVAKTMGVEPDRLVTVHQIHSADVLGLTEPFTGEAPQADGLVTSTPGIALGVLTADCQPILFADHNAGVIGAAHAGWRGELDGVIEATIAQMEAIGAKRADICVAIGPSISQRAYEVSPDFIDAFLTEDPNNDRFFANGQSDKLLFDLPSFGLSRLRGAGIENAVWTGHCTYSDADRFFSFRRTTHAGEADYGRMISSIVL